MRESAGRKNAVRKLRVAAYCRVSTEEEEQQGSFEIQKLYYTEKIESTVCIQRSAMVLTR